MKKKRKRKKKRKKEKRKKKRKEKKRKKEKKREVCYRYFTLYTGRRYCFVKRFSKRFRALTTRTVTAIPVQKTHPKYTQVR
jgi:hypothetical protein